LRLARVSVMTIALVATRRFIKRPTVCHRISPLGIPLAIGGVFNFLLNRIKILRESWTQPTLFARRTLSVMNSSASRRPAQHIGH
jgi:hypothetical protein